MSPVKGTRLQVPQVRGRERRQASLEPDLPHPEQYGLRRDSHDRQLREAPIPEGLH